MPTKPLSWKTVPRLNRISDMLAAHRSDFQTYEQMPVRHCCLLSGSLIDTPAGRQPVDCLRPGDMIWGYEHDQKVPARVDKIYRAESAGDSTLGYRLSSAAVVAETACLYWQGHWVHPDQAALPPARFQGPVYDLQTTTGNFYCQGVLIGHPDEADLTEETQSDS